MRAHASIAADEAPTVATAWASEEAPAARQDPIATGEVGPYRLIHPLGSGGMSTVYLAVHARLGRRVAVKVLHPHLARDPGALARFFAEGTLANRVHHPGVVDVVDVIHVPERSCAALVMELVDGRSLHDMLETGPLPSAALKRIARGVIEALSAMHAAGVIHRDLKPENVLVSPTGGVKIIDLGIADGPAGTGVPGIDPDETMGTPPYMAPEQISALPTSRATDVYALGELLYEMATGRRAYDAHDVSVLRGKLDGNVPDHDYPASLTLSEADDLHALILSCLKKKQEERPGLAEVSAALERALPTRRPRKARIFGAVALAAAALLGSALGCELASSPATSAAIHAVARR